MAPASMEIGRVAVIGAGTMGSGIAQVFAQAGCEVLLQARRRESLERAVARIEANQRLMIEGGLLTEAEARAARRRLAVTTEIGQAVAGVEFVSENVPEDLALKRELFGTLDRLAPPEAILSTDTSGLPISEIAAATRTPRRVVGLHWVNPPHLVPAVEVVSGRQTSPETVATTCALAERLGKVPIRVARDVPGFVWNRLQFAILREALHICEAEIARPEDVDLALTHGLGFRWSAIGPLRLVDLAGLDIFHTIARYLLPELSRATEPPRLLADLVRDGRVGAKAGVGFYPYPPGAAEEAIARRDRQLIAFLKARRADPDGEGPAASSPMLSGSA